jgi:hypothetical protein
MFKPPLRAPFRAFMSTAHFGSGLVRAMRGEFLFLTAGDFVSAGFLLGVFDRGGSFGVVGTGASIRAVSVISSPKRAATSLSSRTFSALGVALIGAILFETTEQFTFVHIAQHKKVSEGFVEPGADTVSAAATVRIIGPVGQLQDRIIFARRGK